MMKVFGYCRYLVVIEPHVPLALNESDSFIFERSWFCEHDIFSRAILHGRILNIAFS